MNPIQLVDSMVNNLQGISVTTYDALNDKWINSTFTFHTNQSWPYYSLYSRVFAVQFRSYLANNTVWLCNKSLHPTRVMFCGTIQFCFHHHLTLVCFQLHFDVAPVSHCLDSFIALSCVSLTLCRILFCVAVCYPETIAGLSIFAFLLDLPMFIHLYCISPL